MSTLKIMTVRLNMQFFATRAKNFLASYQLQDLLTKYFLKWLKIADYLVKGGNKFVVLSELGRNCPENEFCWYILRSSPKKLPMQGTYHRLYVLANPLKLVRYWLRYWWLKSSWWFCRIVTLQTKSVNTRKTERPFSACSS